jgi:hypothetical protein
MVIALITNERYREALRNGVEAVGFGCGGGDEQVAALEVAKEFNPTHMSLRAPLMGFRRWGLAGDFSLSLTLADSFYTTGLRAWWRRRRLASTLNHPKIRWVGNHGVSASRSLTRMGSRLKSSSRGTGRTSETHRNSDPSLRFLRMRNGRSFASARWLNSRAWEIFSVPWQCWLTSAVRFG